MARNYKRNEQYFADFPDHSGSEIDFPDPELIPDVEVKGLPNRINVLLEFRSAIESLLQEKHLTALTYISVTRRSKCGTMVGYIRLVDKREQNRLIYFVDCREMAGHEGGEGQARAPNVISVTFSFTAVSIAICSSTETTSAHPLATTTKHQPTRLNRLRSSPHRPGSQSMCPSRCQWRRITSLSRPWLVT